MGIFNLGFDFFFFFFFLLNYIKKPGSGMGSEVLVLNSEPCPKMSGFEILKLGSAFSVYRFGFSQTELAGSGRLFLTPLISGRAQT